jgi:hypothetical protein
MYPVGIGGDDTHVSAELRRLNVPFGYPEWPHRPPQ